MAPSPLIWPNFGANLEFRIAPQDCHAPRSEAEVLQILAANRGRQIRTIGSLHSWSQAPHGEQVVISLQHLNQVTVQADGPDPWAEIQAGCQIKRILTELQRQGGYTLPSQGLITEQTIAGATSTATHGSGKQSLCHFIIGMRVACYDPVTGEPRIRVIDTPEELRAARCALGNLGIITAIRIAIRPAYQVEEHFRRYTRLEDVLAQEAEYPLQQFFYIPWNWDFYAQHRRETSRPRSWSRPLYRLYWSVGMDVVLHLVVRMLARQLPRICTRIFFKWILPWLVPQGWKVVDRSVLQLSMEHELFRHIEMELFVTRSQLPVALECLTWILKLMRGEQVPAPAMIPAHLQTADVLQRQFGSFQQHYPICIRRVLPDDALLSMSSARNAGGVAEDSYAISLISYDLPHRRAGFFQFCDWTAQVLFEVCAARPHWGKYCPLRAEQLRQLYPRFAEFTAFCHASDPAGNFRNAWTKELLG